MTVALSSPVTGAAQTGFTAPTYTVVADVAPTQEGKQWAVTALGGTQAGVTIHSVASPFTVTVVRPKNFKFLGKPNPITNVISGVGRNVWTVIVRKGVTPLAGQPFQTLICRATVEVPAGSDTADASNIRGCLSLLIGALNQVSAGFGDSTVSGIL